MKRDELPPNYEEICAAFEKSGGEITPDVEQLLNTFDLKAGPKADPIAALIRDADEAHEAWKQEAARVASHARLAKTTAESLKDWLLLKLKKMRVTELKGVRFVVSKHGNTQPSIEWKGKGEIPEEFRKTTEIKLDSAKARVAWAAKTLPKGFLAYVGDHLRISG